MDSGHSCSYYCERPECIKAQRNELRDNADKQSATIAALRREVASLRSDVEHLHQIAAGHLRKREAAERELAACREERDIWFDYIDPFDMYPEHRDLWHTRKAEIDARGAKSA